MSYGSFNEINPVDLQVLLRTWSEKTSSELNCIKVGIIDTFNPITQTATIQITTKRQVDIKSLDPNDPPILVDYPLLLDCPIVLPGGFNSGLTFPDVVGSECLILFNDREIDNWYISGNVQPLTSLRMHDLSDGFALLRPRSIPKAIANYDVLNSVWFQGDTNIKIGLLGAEINALITNISGEVNIAGNLVVEGNIIVGGDFIVSGGSFD